MKVAGMVVATAALNQPGGEDRLMTEDGLIGNDLGKDRSLFPLLQAGKGATREDVPGLDDR